MVSEVKIRNIINYYKMHITNYVDPWLIFAANQSSLSDAIRVSCLCINENNKRHSHQYRLKKQYLDNFYSLLIAQNSLLKKSKNFDDLFTVVDGIKTYGISNLTKYDIAQRIGMYLKLYPTKIYVHRGTRIGAQYLIGKIKTRTITKDQLPGIFQDPELSCAEIEDILCIFKDKFKDTNDSEL